MYDLEVEFLNIAQKYIVLYTKRTRYMDLHFTYKYIITNIT